MQIMFLVWGVRGYVVRVILTRLIILTTQVSS
jgi:hypothetical protein